MRGTQATAPDHPAAVVHVHGPGGVGKSALLRALTAQADHAVVRLDGRDTQAMKRREWSRLVALVPQTPLVPPGMRVADYVLLGRYPHRAWTPGWGAEDERHARRAIAQVDLHGRPRADVEVQRSGVGVGECLRLEQDALHQLRGIALDGQGNTDVDQLAIGARCAGLESRCIHVHDEPPVTLRQY